MASTRQSSVSRRLTGLFAAGAALALGACSPGSPSPTPSSSGSASLCEAQGGACSPITLTIQDFSVAQRPVYDATIAAYEKLYPNVTVRWDTNPNQTAYYSGLTTQYSQNTLDDIFFYKTQTGDPTGTMQQLQQLGWIQPMQPAGDSTDIATFENTWKADAGVQPSFIDGINMQGGKPYSFPFTDTKAWGPGYFYWNKALFKKAGLDPNTPPATWSALMSDCATIKSKLSLPCFAMPMSPSNQLQRLWYALSGSTQSDLFFDYKTGSFDLSEPGIQEAFTQIQTMYNDGYIVPGLNTLAASRSQMIAGQAVMYTDGAWIPGQVFGPAGFNNYGVAATPAPDAGRTGALSQLPTQNVYWVNSKIATTHAEAAWKFIQYITQPDGIFVQTYLKDNFGTLAYANNAKYLGSNPQLATVLSLGETKGFRVANPVPLQQCPDLAQSQAFAKATNAISTTAEWDAIATALTSKSSLMAAATNIVNTRNNILTTTLATEAGGATPLKVSINCYKFPTWNYTQDFDQKYSPPK